MSTVQAYANSAADLLTNQNTAKATAAAASSSSTSATSSSTSSTDDSSDITSSDFLTLLVTEMQNQDPTQPTDPNEYIQQMVGVNSLQQLIQINQDLTGIGSSSTTGGSNVSTPVTAS